MGEGEERKTREKGKENKTVGRVWTVNLPLAVGKVKLPIDNCVSCTILPDY